MLLVIRLRVHTLQREYSRGRALKEVCGRNEQNSRAPAAADLLSRDRASIAERDFEDTAGGSEKSRPKNTIDIFPSSLLLAGNFKRRLTVNG